MLSTVQCKVLNDFHCSFKPPFPQTQAYQEPHTCNLYVRELEGDTYDFDAMACDGGECPGACLLAGVFIWPIGACDSASHTVHNVITAGWKNTSTRSTSLPCIITAPHRPMFKLHSGAALWYLAQGSVYLLSSNHCNRKASTGGC